MTEADTEFTAGYERGVADAFRASEADTTLIRVKWFCAGLLASILLHAAFGTLVKVTLRWVC